MRNGGGGEGRQGREKKSKAKQSKAKRSGDKGCVCQFSVPLTQISRVFWWPSCLHAWLMHEATNPISGAPRRGIPANSPGSPPQSKPSSAASLHLLPLGIDILAIGQPLAPEPSCSMLHNPALHMSFTADRWTQGALCRKHASAAWSRGSGAGNFQFDVGYRLRLSWGTVNRPLVWASVN